MSTPDDDAATSTETGLGRRNIAGIAKRAIANLDLVQEQRRDFGEGHEVTQIFLTSLAVLVSPWDRGLRDQEAAHELASSSWESWDESDHDDWPMLRHLRNGIAHGRVWFDSSSREPSDVWITFQDGKPGGAANWEARIRADELESLVRSLATHLQSDA